jgi:hypothetical protein
MNDMLLLREIRDELRGIRQALEGRTAPDPAHAEFLRAVHAVCSGAVFTSGDLAEYAALAGSEALRAAILGVCRAAGARPIGRALRRLEGADIDGLRLERVRIERDGIVWRVAVNAVHVTAFAVAAGGAMPDSRPTLIRRGSR